MKDSLGSRIKKYEKVYNQTLTPNSCVFIRVDGKAFHTFTKGSQKPYDQTLIDAMCYAMVETSKLMTGFKMAYTQSDECTFMITDFDSIETQGWFDYELNKLVSISASAFTAFFNWYWHMRADMPNFTAMFDSRAFVVPESDAPNVFVWRQKDWYRNSIQMLAQSLFSQKQLNGKKIPEVLEMLKQKGSDWDYLSDQLKYGTFYTPDEVLHGQLDYSELKFYMNGLNTVDF